MEEMTTISQLMSPPQDFIEQDEVVLMARRRLESEATRSLIVVDGKTPVGLVSWRQIAAANNDSSKLPVSAIMSKAVPELTPEMTVSEARTRLRDVDTETVPVVDGSGYLVGEVRHSALAHRETVSSEAEAVEPTVGIDEPTNASSTLGSLAKDMTVVGPSGSKLGSVSDLMVTVNGQLGDIVVSYGVLGRKHKRIGADLIQEVTDDRVTLLIDHQEFKALPDLEEAGEAA